MTLSRAVGVGVRSSRQNTGVLDALSVCLVFFLRVILKQKKLKNIRNYDGFTLMCDPGLIASKAVCPV